MQNPCPNRTTCSCQVCPRATTTQPSNPQPSKVKSGLILVLASVVFLLASTRSASAASATTTTLTVTTAGSAVSTVVSPTVVTLTATVLAGSTAVTTGQVNFCDAAAPHCTDIHILSTAQLTSAGTATYKFRPGPGSHTYQAYFLGTSTGTLSGSNSASLTVTPTGNYATTTTITTTPHTAPNPRTGAGADYTSWNTQATVGRNGPIAPEPTGAISFVDTSANNAVLATAALTPNPSTLKLATGQVLTTSQAGLLSEVTADFNGDGIPDLAALTNSSSSNEAVTIFLGNGDGTFTAGPTPPAIGDLKPLSIVVGDFNMDGKKDLAVFSLDGTYAAGILTVLLSNGDGTFTLSAPSPTPGTGAIVAVGTGLHITDFPVVADFNGDGIPDLAIPNTADETLSIMLGVGDGTFTSKAQTSSTTFAETPLAIATGDFNGDGIADLAISSFDTNYRPLLIILTGDGDGTFTQSDLIALKGFDIQSIVVGDFNQDSHLDLVITTPDQSHQLGFLLGNGDGTFNKPVDLTPAGSFQGTPTVAVGDFDGDGKADLVVLDSEYPYYLPSYTEILLGNGDGTFNGDGTYYGEANGNSGFEGLSLAVADFTGTGLLEIAVADNDGNIVPNPNQPHGPENGTITVFLPELTQSTPVISLSPTGQGLHYVEAAYVGDSLYNPSTSATVILQTTVYAPAIGPANAGTYASAQTVTISRYYDYNSLQTVYYTTDGSTPTTSSAVYTGPITVSTSQTIQAIATQPGFFNSTVASATYVITGLTLTYSPAALNFNSTVVGTTSAAQTITLTNTGAAAITFGTVAFTGANTKSFVLSNRTCQNTLAVHATCSFSVEFKPAITGSLSATLSITDNAAGSPQTIALTGVATTNPTPVLTISPASLAFPATTEGTTTPAQTLTLANTGSAPVTLGTMAFKGANTKSFVESSKTCGASIAVGASCTISIEFKPAIAGNLSASFGIGDNAAGSPQSVVLTGIGN